MNRASTSPCVAICAAWTLALSAVAVNLHAQAPTPAPAAEVPVREVVLYSSGVGYFQHEGTVQDAAIAELRFKTAQINDVLKSLVLQDLDGGRFGVVTYPSRDPLEKTLGSFQVDLSDNPSLSDLLGKLRGARVAVSAGGENFSATILGVETRQVAGGKEGAPIEKSFINFVSDKGLRSLELEAIAGLKLVDPGLQEELNRALAAIAGARDQDKKPVELQFNGQGQRRVRIGYVIETPVWKASYRLIFGDPAAGGKPTATLQGWAAVDNQTDNDWKDVRLSLVSGRPISFVQDLYQPLYVPRPIVVPEAYASLRPQEYAEGQKEGEEAKPAGAVESASVDAPVPRPRRAFAAKALDEAASVTAAAPAPAPAPMNPVESVAPLGSAGAVGELFEYPAPNVTLARQRSAMIPILNDPFEVEKVSVFNQAVLDRRPLNGARLRNNSPAKIHLLQGPVTVYDGGRYAGDARLDDVAPGQERLLTYGVDLQMLVQVRDLGGPQAVQSGRIVAGTLEVTHKVVDAHEYSIENQADHDKRLVIEHPLRPGWKLVQPAKALETTANLSRFEQTAIAGKTEKFPVTEEHVEAQQVSLLDSDMDDVLTYSRMGEIAPAVRDALVKAAGMKHAIADVEHQLEERDAQTKAIAAEQARIRENLKTVDRNGAYGTRLLKKLDDQETQLERLRTESDTFRDKLDGQRKALGDYLSGLNVG